MTTGPDAGPCLTSWPLVQCDIFPASTAAISGAAVQAATSILWAKSGRQFDQCSVTLRPCRESCYGNQWPWSNSWNDWGVNGQWPFPYLYAGQWFNLGCGGCPGSCSCNVLFTVKLPNPVVSITQIKVDGSPLATGSYILYDYDTLVKTDGVQWPLCNDLSKPDSAVGTWSITVQAGTPIPILGQMAVGELALQLALACVGDSSCQLPANTQQIIRQGVTFTKLDPNIVFAAGKLGLYRCDLFISTFNPGGLPERAHVYDVDGPRAKMQTWP